MNSYLVVFSKVSSQAEMKVLIVKTSSLGDIVHALPAVPRPLIFCLQFSLIGWLRNRSVQSLQFTRPSIRLFLSV